MKSKFWDSNIVFEMSTMGCDVLLENNSIRVTGVERKERPEKVIHTYFLKKAKD